jgi:hypothetical protein
MKVSSQKRKWKMVRQVAQKIGWDVFPYRPNYHYVPDYYGKAAAKGINILDNSEFKSLADVPIRGGRTLLYYDRLYVIYQALMQVKRLGSSGIEMEAAEVGTYRGGTTYFIASVHKALGLPLKEIHCFDTFEGHSGKDINEKSDSYQHKSGMFNDVSFSDVREYLSAFDRVRAHQGRFQDTCHEIQGRKFGFVHLDVDLYEPIYFGLNFFDKHLVRGGVIVVDDYGTRSCPGVIKAVEEFMQGRQDYFLLHPFTEQCVLVKL